MKNFSINEFKPTIFFLIKFIGIYVVANLLYGWFVTTYYPRPDPVTQAVSQNTATTLHLFGRPAITLDDPDKPTTQLICDGRSVLAIYEGCNGINIMIIFVAFLFAFGPVSRTMIWFVPTGLIILHAMNLVRIVLLFYVSLYMPRFMYFTHKYFFTAILYVVVFVLWIWWVRRDAKVQRSETP